MQVTAIVRESDHGLQPCTHDQELRSADRAARAHPGDGMTAVIVDAVRTPVGTGRSAGALAGVHPVDLLATVLRDLIARNELDPGLVDDVIGGCVSQASEQAMNLTRNAVLAAGFPVSVPATTVDRRGGRLGLQTVCEGGGIADAMIIELL